MKGSYRWIAYKKRLDPLKDPIEVVLSDDEKCLCRKKRNFKKGPDPDLIVHTKTYIQSKLRYGNRTVTKKDLV